MRLEFFSGVLVPIDSFDGLCTFLESEGLILGRHADAPVVRTAVTFRGARYELVFSWRAGDFVAQVVLPFGEPVPDDALSRVALALLHLNGAVPFPDFGLDSGNHRLFYRVSVPFLGRDGIAAEELRLFLHLVVRTVYVYGPVLERVAQGGLPADQVVDAARVAQQVFARTAELAASSTE